MNSPLSTRRAPPAAPTHCLRNRRPSLRPRQPNLLLLLATLALFRTPALIAATHDPLAAWLNAQTNLQSWSADVIQTRTLKSLAQPHSSTGRVWFATPNRFRWELGNPPQTIAVRQTDQMLVIYPKLKHAEKYPLTGRLTGPWRDTLALLDAGFPQNRDQFEARFRILSQSTSNDLHELTLQPKSSSARKIMPQLKITFTTNDLSLRATELRFADGSTMRNDFLRGVLNPKIDDSLFAPALSDDYRIVEPLSHPPGPQRTR